MQVRNITQLMSMMKKMYFILLFLSLVGLADAGYLTYEYYAKIIPPCTIGSLFDCGTVIKSSYGYIFNIPVSLWGVVYYSILSFTDFVFLMHKKRQWIHIFSIVSVLGFLFSVYFVYVQIFILKALCFYCMLSAINSFIIFILIIYIWIKKARP